MLLLSTSLVFLPERENKMCLNHFCKESKVTVDIALIVY